ncbi:cytochrome P450 [Favolaschia claudopus]|uniref:Cytochrome P450 n=1 Tax=Favolaschia claudopus TaxID=2862362 RepID=A0AAV9ZAP6_9AGAR
MSMDSTSLYLGAFIALALSLILYRPGKTTPLPLIPHNKLKWFLGDIIRMANEKGSITYAFNDTATRLGRVSQVVDSQEMHNVLVNSAFLHKFAAPIPQGLLALPTSSGIMNATMTNPFLAQMSPRIFDLMQEIVDLWSVGARRLGSNPMDVIDVLNDLRLTTIDVRLHYFRHLVQRRPNIPKLAADLEILFDTIGDGLLFPAPRFLPWLTRTFNRKGGKAIASTHDYLRGRLHAARAQYASEGREAEKAATSKADTVLDIILGREKEDWAKGAETRSEAEIMDESTALALGGSGTPSYRKHDAVERQDTLQALRRPAQAPTELLTKLLAISTRAPTFAEISDGANLPYLFAVLYKILRCSRVASTQLESDGAKDVTDGLDGLDAVRSALSKQRWRTGYWFSKDVRAFVPERWLRADGSFDPNAGPWLPFSCGYMGGFGQKLALLELRLFLSTI